MGEWFAMGGYAGFVWTAYGLTFVTLATMLIATLRRLKAAERSQQLNPRRNRS